MKDKQIETDKKNVTTKSTTSPIAYNTCNFRTIKTESYEKEWDDIDPHKSIMMARLKRRKVGF